MKALLETEMTASQLLKSGLDELGARDRILRTALILFNQKGVHRTGTDLIIEQANVAKMTFYRLFESKAHLIAECLKLRDSDWFSLLHKHVDRQKTPETKALALFDAFDEWFKQTDYAGCPFIRSLYDFNFEEDDQEIVGVIQSHFSKIQTLVTHLLKAARPKDYEHIVPLFIALLSGSIVVSQVSRSPDIARASRAQAEALLRSKPKQSRTRA